MPKRHVRKNNLRRSHSHKSPVKKILIFVLFAAVFGLVARFAFSSSQTLVLNKYNFGDIFGRAINVNDLGQIMIWGSDSPDFSTWHAMFAQDGNVYEDIDSATIGNNVYVSDTNSFNNNGEFVGVVNYNGVNQGFLYQINTQTVSYMGTSFSGVSAVSSTAIAINNNSQVLGMYKVNGDDCDHLLLWTGGTYKLLNTATLGCSLRVFGMNDNGYFVGYVELPSGDKTAFLYNTAAGTFTTISDRANNWTNIEPQAVNINNVVVGGARLASDQMGGQIAFRWTNGNFDSLGTLPGGTKSLAYSIDNDGNVVGESDVYDTTINPPTVRAHGFVYTSNQLVDLGILDTSDIGVNSFGSNSLDINNGHLIVGSNYANIPDPGYEMTTIYIPVEYDYMFTKRIKPTKLKKPHMTPTPHPSSKPPQATPSIQPV